MRITLVIVWLLLTIGFFARHDPAEAAVRSLVIAVALVFTYTVVCFIRAAFRRMRKDKLLKF